MALDRTFAVVDKTVKDFTRISFWVTIVVQVVFLALYGYKIYLNLDHLTYLIIYSVLALISMFGFIFYLSTYRSRKKKAIKGTKKGLRIFKYFANGAMMVAIIVEFALNGVTSDLELIISGISMISFILQIIFELVRSAYTKYSELLIIAIRLDVAGMESFITKTTNPKETFFSALNVPLKKLSRKIKGEDKPADKEKTKTEQYVEQLGDDYRAKKKEKKAERVKKQKDEIKENLKTIFGFFRRKKKTKADEN